MEGYCYPVPLLRQSVGITSDTVPDEITFCEFRGFLVARDLTR